MKKFVALLLAVMMLAATAIVVADTPSVQPPKPVVKTAVAYIIEVPNATKGQEYEDKIVNGAVIADLFTEETNAQITALVGEETVMHQLVSLAVTEHWTPVIGDVTCELEFDTQYKAGETVAAVLSIFTADGVTEVLLDAEVKEDYVVTIKFPADWIKKMKVADENVLVIVSKSIAE